MKILPPMLLVLLATMLIAQAQTRIIPHVTAPGGGYQTTLFLENFSTEEGTYQLVPYSAGGQALRSASGTISAMTIQAYTPDQLFTTAESISHIVITTSSPHIQVTASYRAASGVGSPAHVTETQEPTFSSMFYPGEWDAVFDGLAMVNMGSAAAEIILRQVAFDGTEIQSEIIAGALAPMAKALYVVGGPSGSAFAEMPTAVFELQSSENLAIVALRGTTPGAPLGVLWANPPKPIPESFTPSDEALVAFYPLDGDAYDASGEDHHGTTFGAQPEVDRFGQASGALKFDGRDDYVEIPHASSLNLKLVSITAWVKTSNATTDTVIVGKGDEVPYYLGTRGGRFEFRVGSPANSSHILAQSQVNGGWQFVAGVFDGSEVRIYVDGVLENSEAFDGSMSFDNRPLNLGRNPHTEDHHYVGMLDEIRIYERGLSQQEVIALHGKHK